MRATIVQAFAALTLLAAPALAAEPATVTTQATAHDRLANTVADVTLAVEARGRTMAEVQTALAAGSAPLMTYLGGAGVERLRTQGVALQPEVEQNPTRGQPPRIVGYSGRLTVVFLVEAGKMGAVLTDALAHGANTIDGAAWHPRDAEIDAARRRLAAAATKSALDQAGVVAEAAGRHAGPVRSIVVDPAAQGFPRPMQARGMALAAAAPMALEAGDSDVAISVTATVTLTEP
jgi:uncharacterized protein YggE